jgi:hypothetical protein
MFSGGMWNCCDRTSGIKHCDKQSLTLEAYRSSELIDEVLVFLSRSLIYCIKKIKNRRCTLMNADKYK